MKEPYQRLEIWQRANSLCLRLFKMTNELPPQERMSLFTNIRVSSESVPMKIAEGAISDFIKEFTENLKDSYRVLIKLKTEILIARHLRYISKERLSDLDYEINELIRLVFKMIKSLEYKETALSPAFAYSLPAFITN